jgi:phosphopantetheine adenylyltransferase
MIFQNLFIVTPSSIPILDLSSSSFTKGRIVDADYLVRRFSEINNSFSICITSGCFDGLHKAHKNIFSEMVRPIPQYIVVGLNSDQWIREHKGRDLVRPFNLRVFDIFQQLEAYIKWYSNPKLRYARLFIIPIETEEPFPTFLSTIFSYLPVYSNPYVHRLQLGYDPYSSLRINLNYFKGIEYLPYKAIHGNLPEIESLISMYETKYRGLDPISINLNEVYVDNLGLPHSSDMIKISELTKAIKNGNSTGSVS